MDSLRPARILLPLAIAVFVLLSGCLSSVSLGEDPVSVDTPTPLATNIQGTPGVTRDEILFGQSTDFAETGLNLQLEIQAAFREVNAKGGVNGRTFRLIALDDDYEAAKAIRNTVRLIENDEVFVILGSAGTPTSRAVLPITAEAGVPYIAPFSGADFLREPELTNVINLRASYSQETEALVNWLINERGLSRIGVMYQDDPYGRSGYSGVIQVLRKRDMQPVAISLYTPNTNAIKTSLLDLTPAYPQVVILVGTFEPVAKLIEWARRTGLHSQFFTVSVAAHDGLLNLLGNEGARVYATQVMPLVTETPQNVLDSYEDALYAQDPTAPPNFVSLEGYLAVRLVILGVSSCGDELDRKCFLDTIKNSEFLSIDRFRLRFGEDDNQGSDAVYLIVIGADGKFHPVATLVESVS